MEVWIILIKVVSLFISRAEATKEMFSATTDQATSEYWLEYEYLKQYIKNMTKNPIEFYKKENTTYGDQCASTLFEMFQDYAFIMNNSESYHSFITEQLCCLCFLEFCDRPRTDEEQSLYLEIIMDAQSWQYKTALHKLKEVSGLLVVFLPGVIGNLILLIVIFHHMGKEIPATNYFIASMAISDFMTSLFCCPLQALEVLTAGKAWAGSTPFLVFLCKFLPFIFFLSINCSILMMLGMGIERYLVTCHPLRAAAWVTRRRVLCSILLIWMTAVVFASPILYLRDAERGDLCMISQNHLIELEVFYGVNLFVVYAVPVVILVVLYAKITRTLMKSIQASTAMQRISATAKPQDNTTGRIQLIRTLIVMVVIFVVSWAPYLILTFIHPIDTGRTFYQKYFVAVNLSPCESVEMFLDPNIKLRADEHKILAAVASLSFLSPALNPIVMPIMSKRFRAGYVRAFRCCFIACKNKRSPTESEADDEPTLAMSTVTSTRL